MARSLNTSGRASKRGDLPQFDPRGIIFDINDNSRWKPPGAQPINHARVVKLAKEFLDPAIGQLQPIVIRISEKNCPKAIAGFHRLAAALLIVEGSPADGIPKDEDFMISAIIKDVNEAEGFENSARENIDRESLTPVDMADIMRKMRGFGRDDDHIREVLKVSDGWLTKLAKILRLPDDLKLAVHRRVLTADAALPLADMSKAEQEKALADAWVSFNAPENVDGQGILNGDEKSGIAETLANRALTSEAAKAIANVDPKDARKISKAVRKATAAVRASKGETTSLKRKEMRDGWKFMADPKNEASTECKRMLATAMLEWSDGKKGDKALHNVLDKIMLVKPRD